MRKPKTERNKAMLKDYLFQDMPKASIADKYGMRPQTAGEILDREYSRYIKNKETYFEEEKTV